LIYYIALEVFMSVFSGVVGAFLSTALLSLSIPLAPLVQQTGPKTVQKPALKEGRQSTEMLRADTSEKEEEPSGEDERERGKPARKFNIMRGGKGSTLTGTNGADLFIVTSPGAKITNFTIGQDVLRITANEVNFFDLVNSFQTLITPPMAGNTTDTLISLPDGSNTIPLVVVQGVTPEQFKNSPASFSFRTTTNPVVDWNEITFDSTRTSAVGPARSTRYYALTQIAIYDAVQGIVKKPGRTQYLKTKDPNFRSVPAPAQGASAEAAANAAAHKILRSIFTNPDNVTLPSSLFGQTTRIGVQNYIATALDAALTDSLRQVKGTPTNIAAGQAYGEAIAGELLALRTNDGAFRNQDNSLVDPTLPEADPLSFGFEYQNGIEPAQAVSENDGTVGRTADNPMAYFLNQPPINQINNLGIATTSTTPTTAGAWRRSEDTYSPITGLYQALAAPEWANINTAWVLPVTNFFDDNVAPPPTLESDRYRAAVEQVKSEGSITDLPRNSAGGSATGTGNVVLPPAIAPTFTDFGLGATTTTNGVTTANATGLVGLAVDDNDPADSNYNDLGARTPDGIGTTSAERTILSHVWANDDGSYQPNGSWQKITQQITEAKKLNLADTAYTFALVDIGLADAFINIWDIKWDEDYFWRPVSGIRNSDQIPNVANLVDPNWTPRQITPQHPCHPSGTSNSAGVTSTILIGLFGETVPEFRVGAGLHPGSARLRQALQSVNGNNLVPEVPTAANRANPTELVDIDDVFRTYTNLRQAAEEARNSRVFSGAHFRFATENGVGLGRQIGNYILGHNPLSAS
jgi:Vanadium chloroperoxidase N-terminal domain